MLVRRLLKNQPIELKQSQQKNIFHTRCKILQNICLVIVDNGSFCNGCSSSLVEKLSLTTIPHPKPYKLERINNNGEIVVKEHMYQFP